MGWVWEIIFDGEAANIPAVEQFDIDVGIALPQPADFSVF
jgi:hypothetical protein